MIQRQHDQRCIRTRQAIVGAFSTLVIARPYDDIRVGDIITQAAVGRSTFYEHYRNKDDVLRESVGPIIGILADAAGEAGDAARISMLLEHVWQTRRTSRIMLNGPAAAAVTRVLSDLIAGHLAAAARQTGGRLIIPVRLAADQIAEAQLALLRGWLNGVARCPARTLAAAILETTRRLAGSLVAGTPRPSR